eukprot:13255067-Alexandrium_andersonii.AAC.1
MCIRDRNPPDEALEGALYVCFRPPSARYGLRIAHRLRIAAGLGARPDCRTADSSRTREDVYQAR